MQTLAILFTLALLSPAVLAEEYCYYDDFDNWVCRNSLSIAARAVIAIISFVVVSAFFIAFTIMRRRRIARAITAAQNQQGFQNQYPPQQPQGGFFGMPFGGFGQKAMPSPGPQQYQPQYAPQQDGGEFIPQYNVQPDQHYTGQPDPQYTGQPNPQNNAQYPSQYNAPQYPPPSFNSQPAPPYGGFTPPLPDKGAPPV